MSDIIQAQAARIAMLTKQVERQSKETPEEYAARWKHYERVEERIRQLKLSPENDRQEWEQFLTKYNIPYTEQFDANGGSITPTPLPGSQYIECYAGIAIYFDENNKFKYMEAMT